MECFVIQDAAEREKADICIIPFWGEVKAISPACKVDKDFLNLFEVSLSSEDFKGGEGEHLLVYGDFGAEKRALLLGLGKEENASEETLRRTFAEAINLCRKKKYSNVTIFTPTMARKKEHMKAFFEGVLLANYSFSYATSKDRDFLVKVINFVGLDKTACKLYNRVKNVCDAVCFTRDLANTNADDMYPEKIGEIGQALAKEFKSVSCKVLDRKALEKNKLGLLIAVGKGSAKDPTLVILEYKGKPSSKENFAVVGKGLTFDAGGLNLKPTGSIETMRFDMSGGAAVLGIIKAAALLKLPVNIIGVIPSAENAIGSHSYKPGDTYTSYSGKTVEISNTDAEGRLILADALSYLQKNFKPSYIVDLATLTGAIVVALGRGVSGFFANDEKLAKAVKEAGQKSGELVWQLPLFEDYKEYLKSDIADIKNSASGREGGSITAALFLREFINNVPWVHVDIAGTCDLPKPKFYNTSVATGVGVRLVISLLEEIYPSVKL